MFFPSTRLLRQFHEPVYGFLIIFSNELIQKISALGLKEKEAEVYFALLKLDKEPVGKISKETGLTKQNLYNYLADLKNKNLGFLLGFIRRHKVSLCFICHLLFQSRRIDGFLFRLYLTSWTFGILVTMFRLSSPRPFQRLIIFVPFKFFFAGFRTNYRI